MINTLGNRSQIKQFVDLPAQLYKGDLNWVNPLVGSNPREFSSANPAMQNLDLELYLTMNDNTPVGRIAAFVDKTYNALHRDQTAFFGFFECSDDPAAAEELFAAVDQFARTRGMKKIIGPVDFSTNYQTGLLIDGLDLRPTVMTPYSKKYYPQLVEAAGYIKAMDLYAYTFDTGIPDRLQRMETALQKRHPEIMIKSLAELSRINKVTILRDIYNEAFSENWGFLPMDKHEFSHLLHSIVSLKTTDLNYMAFSGNIPIGILLTVPDLYSPEYSRVQKKPLSKSKSHTKLRVTVLGVLSVYRRKGIEALLSIKLLRDANRKGYKTMEFSVILENNTAMNNMIKREFALTPTKTFRTYEKLLV